MRQVDFPLRCFDALGRFLLERMNDPDIGPDLHCIDNAKRVPSMLEYNFEHPGIEALERPHVVGFAAFGRDGQCAQAFQLSRLWESLEFLSSRLDP